MSNRGPGDALSSRQHDVHPISSSTFFGQRPALASHPLAHSIAHRDPRTPLANTHLLPARPSRARRQPPSFMRTPRRPCADKRKRLKSLKALRAARTTPPQGPKTALTALRSPRSGRHGVRPSTRCRVQTAPFFLLQRLSELGILVPAPAPSSLRLPFATPAARRLRPFAPASRHRFPPVPLAPLILPSRARLPSPVACRLLPLPARPPSLRPPLPTSGLSRSPPVPHLPITGEKPPNHEQVNPHFVCVSDAHARNRKGASPLPLLV